MTPIVFANFLAPNMTSAYAVVATRVGQRLGRPTELIQGTSLAQLTEGFYQVDERGFFAADGSLLVAAEG